MDHTTLGRTGLSVSRLCLGTMTFGVQCDEATSTAILDRAADGGIDFIDTADIYPLGGDLTTVGRTEEILGRWLEGKRDRFVVATKCYGPTGPAPFDSGNSRKHIMSAVDASLRRLGTDYVDLYQVHFDDPATPLDETLGAFDDLVHQGKVRYVGCSNFLAYRLARAIGRSEVLGLVRFETLQPRYNLLFRQIERELLPLCAEENIGVIPYNPIAGGMLTGKHAGATAPTEGGRFTLGNAANIYQERYWHDRAFETVGALQSVAEEAGTTLTTLAVAWVLAHPTVTAPIVGASRPDQLAASLAAADFTLEPDVKDRLDELTAEHRMGDAAR
ncbi:MAG TPA: aldo/keto reductase [Acidimicrobiales bacterium]|nr:aldo/keto reductase [Acidimicrobiales bacterium]